MEGERKPLLVGRGLLLLDDFCRETGLSASVISSLVYGGALHGVWFEDGRVAGLFDDVLPSVEQLLSLGLVVKPGYNPDSLRSVQSPEEDLGD